MKKILVPPFLTLCAISVAACSGTPKAATSVATSAAAGISDSIAVSACNLTASEKTFSYLQPGSGADQFAEFDSGATVNAAVRTADGWFGYEPAGGSRAYPQLFRYRWVWPPLGWTAGNGCDALPQVTGPDAGVCYFVAQADTPVRSAGIDVADIVATLPAGGYAALIATTPDWVDLDLSRGSLLVAKQGWAAAEGALYYGFCGPLNETP